MALTDLATDDAIHAFIYGLKPQLKGFVKAQVQAMTDASLNEVMIVTLKLEDNIQCRFQTQQPFKPFWKFLVQG